MSEHPPTRDERFMRAAAWVGDLGNPFYEEERHRDVWNEASAVGFQIVLWAGFVAATAAVWIVGSEAVPYAMALVAIIGVASLVTVAYAERLGIRLDSPERMRRFRMVPYLVLVVALLAGIVVRGDASPGGLDSFRDGLADGTVLGAVVGAAAVLVPAALLVARARRRRAAAEAKSA